MKKVLFTCIVSLFSMMSMAQNVTVTGVVTDKAGETIIGVSVRVKGTERNG